MGEFTEIDRFIGLVAAVCVQRRWNTVADLLRPFSPEMRGLLADEVSHCLRVNSPEAEGAAAQHLPFSHKVQASQEAWRDYRRPPPSDPPARSALTRVAFKLLRQGAGRTVLVDRMRQVNRQLRNPLPDPQLDDLIVWCATRHVADKQAANAG